MHKTNFGVIMKQNNYTLILLIIFSLFSCNKNDNGQSEIKSIDSVTTNETKSKIETIQSVTTQLHQSEPFELIPYRTERYNIINIKFHKVFTYQKDTTKYYFYFNAKINDTHPSYTFKIISSLDNIIISQDTTKVYFPETLEITEDGKSIHTQILDLSKDELIFPTGNKVFYKLTQLVDMNFDGYFDLRLLSGPNYSVNVDYMCYLFEPKSKMFIHHQELSKLSSALFDYRNKYIISFSSLGGTEEQLCYFSIINNILRPILIETSTMYYDKAEVISNIYINGKKKITKEIINYGGLFSKYYELSDSGNIY